MMKSSFLLIFYLFILSCNKERQKPDNFIEKEVLLENHYADKNEQKYFAKINLFIPVEFDTLQIWTDQSDCTGCETYKYRFTSSKNCLIKESGFFHNTICRDSINRLTIEHSVVGRFQRIDTFTLKDIQKYESERQQYSFKRELLYFKGKIEKINGKEFIIARYTGRTYYSAEKDVQTFLVLATADKTTIYFRFECLQEDCSNFDTKALQIIKSIELDTLPNTSNK